MASSYSSGGREEVGHDCAFLSLGIAEDEQAKASVWHEALS